MSTAANGLVAGAVLVSSIVQSVPVKELVKELSFAHIVEGMASPQFSNGLLWMARAMAGEQGGVFPLGSRQSEIGVWIAHTVLNRIRDPRWPNSAEEVIREGFFGYDNAKDHPHLQTQMYNLAFGAVIDRATSEKDVTGGCYWMYSLHDLERWPDSYRESAVRCFTSGEYGLCFFKEPPPS